MCAGDLDWFFARLVSMQEPAVALPARLPVVFNEFCTTWGQPSAQRIHQMLKTLAGRDIDYFVIDAGWYADEEKGGERNMGDWQVNPRLFPHGLGPVAQAIRDVA